MTVESIIDQLRRELRANSNFRRLDADTQVWLIERLTAADYPKYADLAAALAARTMQKPWPLSSLCRLAHVVRKRILRDETEARTRQQVLDTLVRGSSLGADVERLAKVALPGITNALAASLGDRALAIFASRDPDADTVKSFVQDFVAISPEARAYRDMERKDIEVNLSVQKFQRETCELFLRWASDQRAAEIATSTASNTDKIEQLGSLMFGEAWSATQ